MNAHASSTPPSGRRPAKLLSADEVGELLGVPRTFVYTLARRGELPTVHVGERYVRFREETLDQWIAAQESGGWGGGRR